ncbi:juvenile hormone esterase [Calliopsis andreniformis]|uniref:juvenile hormone esterase n=1 Tax=Calliopsis andreniformis TaxID=337506 RepID=UPI003FCED589
MALESPVVNVTQGQLRGLLEKNIYDEPYLAFRGIPYAKPPTGPLRFKDPQPPEPWTGIREAKSFGNVAAQIDMFTRELIGSDDCLYLNVYTSSIEATSKRAVMVWIHGGAFIHGSGDSTIYGPDYLVRKDVVLVTINYRLGVFGFLNIEHEVATGNQGLKDQVMALRWVQENISSFGGDPNNVTIFGESAGAASVHYLAISPLAEGLFHKAIAQSGVVANPWAIISKEPKQYVFRLAASLGKETTDPEEVIEFLKSVDTFELLKAANNILESKHLIFGHFLPTIDDKSPNPIVPQHPFQQMKRGIKVPFLLGHNTCEGAFLVGQEYNSAFREKDSNKVFEKFNTDLDLLIHQELQDKLKKEGISGHDVKRIYFGDRPINYNMKQEYVDYLSDMMFIQGIFDVVQIQTELNSSNTYLYKFSFEDDTSLMKLKLGLDFPGTMHADELPYLFYPSILRGLNIDMKFKPGSEKHKLSEIVTQMWTDFAKTGNPTPMTTDLVSVIWKPVRQGDTYDYLNINTTLKMETTKTEEHTFDWKKIKNKL